MELYKLALLFTLLNIINAQDNNKHMICKEVNDIFSNQNDENYSRRQLQGPMGKRGQPGVKGEPGSPGAIGQPGIVDYEKLEELVRIEIEKKTEQMAAKIYFLEQKYINITEQTEETTTRTVTESTPMLDCENHGGIAVGSKCFIIEAHDSKDTKLSEADQICRNNGAILADISTKQEYDVIMIFARNKIPTRNGYSYLQVWTGMQRDRSGNAVMSNGQISPYKKTKTDATQWTRAEAKRSNVYFEVKSDPNDRNQGIGAIWPAFEFHGSLCVIE